MNERDRVDRLITSWLDERAPSNATAELLADIVSTTSRRRPRPAWLARIEGHHMNVIEGGRSRGLPRLIPFLVLLGLAVALAAAAVGSGAFRNDPQPIGIVEPSPSADAAVASPTPFMRKPTIGDPIPDEMIGSWRERDGDLYTHIFRAGDPACIVYVQTTQDCSILQWAADDFYLSDIQILTIKDGKLHQVEYLGRNCRPNVTDFVFTVDADSFRVEPSPPTPCNSVVVEMVRAGVGAVPTAKPPTNADGPARFD
jgi:hypothetical protein